MIEHRWFKSLEMVKLVQVHRQRKARFLDVLSAVCNREMTHDLAESMRAIHVGRGPPPRPRRGL